MASDLVTYDDYTRITGDDSSDQQTVEANIDEMLAMIEQELDRFLLRGDYTETLPLSETGWVYPRAVPVESVPASASYDVFDEGWSLRGASPDSTAGPFLDLSELRDWSRQGRFSTVTYTGGYVYETFPAKLRRLVCRLAKAAGEGGSQLMSGTTAASVGDVSVSLETGTVGAGELDAIIPGTCKALDRFRRPTY